MDYKNLTTKEENDCVEIDSSKTMKVSSAGELYLENGTLFAESRMSGNFKGVAIYLDGSYDYVLGVDSSGDTILVPLKKKTVG